VASVVIVVASAFLMGKYVGTAEVEKEISASQLRQAQREAELVQELAEAKRKRREVVKEAIEVIEQPVEGDLCPDIPLPSQWHDELRKLQQQLSQDKS